MNDLKGRVSALETAIKAMNTDISSMRTIVNALQERDYITGISELDDKSGYTLTFSKGRTIVIKHGTNGTNGTDAPIIGIDLFEGAYYWALTTNGNKTWLTDGNKNKIKVTGQDGKSAYELAVKKGYKGTLEEWFESLKGSEGKSAYELAKENGYNGSFNEWLTSLNGKDGNNGKSAYELAVEKGYKGSLEEWLNSLKGSNGKSSYELAIEKGYNGTIDEWLISLNGTNGKDGKDGKTPILGVDTDGFWTIDKSDGNGIVRLKDAQGKDVKAIGQDGVSYFKKVTYDDNYVYLTLQDDNQIAIPKKSDYVFEIDGSITQLQSFNYGETKGYIVNQFNIEDFSIYCPSGWRANLKGNTLTVTAPVKENLYADQEGSISIIVTTKQGQCSIVKIQVEINIVLNIPDPNFKTYLVTNFDTNKDGEISKQEAEVVKTIDCSDKNIASLEGIEYFTSLTGLWCGNNELTSLDCQKNTLLQLLGCYNNKLTAINLPKASILEELNCDNNQIKNLDVSGNKALKHLYCSNGILESITIANCTSLEWLACHHNRLTRLPDISTNVKLTIMACNCNRISWIVKVKNLSLQSLSLSYNCLASIDVTECSSLKSLSCSNNPALAEIALGNVPIKQLDLSNIGINDYYMPGVQAAMFIVSGNILENLTYNNNITTQLRVHDCPTLTYIEYKNSKGTPIFYGDNNNNNVTVVYQ